MVLGCERRQLTNAQDLLHLAPLPDRLLDLVSMPFGRRIEYDRQYGQRYGYEQ
jgi:hypothetical protein